MFGWRHNYNYCTYDEYIPKTPSPFIQIHDNAAYKNKRKLGG